MLVQDIVAVANVVTDRVKAGKEAAQFEYRAPK